MTIAFLNVMEMLLTNIQDAAPVQQAGVSPSTVSGGEAQAGDSKFSHIIEKELNNAGNNGKTENPETGAGLPVQSEKKPETSDDVLLSLVNNAVTANMIESQAALISENGGSGMTAELLNGSEGLTIPQTPGENGIKTGALLNEMLNAAVESLSEHLINNNKVDGTDKKTLTALENARNPQTSGENGLKIGALLNEILNASSEPLNNSPQAGLAANSINDSRPHAPSENGLKLGRLLSGLGVDNRQIKGSMDGNNSFHAALTQHAGENAENAEQEGAVPFGGGNAGQGKNARTQGNPATLNMIEDNEILKKTQGILTPERSINMDGLRGIQNNSIKSTVDGILPDSSGTVTHSNAAPGNSRALDAVQVSAAKPAFTEVLDNIVYVIKGNSRLGVSVEHGALGKLDINVSMEKGMLNVHINTSEKTTREFIENNIQHIMDSLSKEGMNVGGMSVALKERRDQGENVFTVDREDNNEKEVVLTEDKRCSVSGLVNVFA